MEREKSCVLVGGRRIYYPQRENRESRVTERERERERERKTGAQTKING
jgi:hypothetical protein